jgi:mono/diheme cytochrome c family protein
VRTSALLALINLLIAMPPALAANGDASSGEAIFNENCATCHGENLRNTGGAFDLKELKADERARFDTSVLGGKGQMPPWKGTLSDKDLDDLWAYVRANAYE